MTRGYVGQQFRRINRNIALANIAILVVVLAVGFSFRDYFLGGHWMTVEDIAAVRSEWAAPYGFVRTRIDLGQIDDVGYEVWGGSPQENGYYHFLHLKNGKVFIIKGDRKLSEEVQGDIRNIPDIVSKMERQSTHFNVLLDADTYWWMRLYLIGFGVPLMGLALWNLGRTALRVVVPRAQGAATQLARVGPFNEIAWALDAERGTARMCGPSVMMTKSWLIRERRFGIDLIYLDDVVWAHKTEKFDGAGEHQRLTSCRAVIYKRTGQRFVWRLALREADGWMQALADRVPWAFSEYNVTLLGMWAQQREAFLAAVDERKEALAG